MLCQLSYDLDEGRENNAANTLRCTLLLRIAISRTLAKDRDRHPLKAPCLPVVLTVNGKAELVVQDAESYQKLLEAKDRMEAIEGIKRGLESMKHGGGKPAEKFFQEFFAAKGIPEHE